MKNTPGILTPIFFRKQGAPQWHELWLEERNHFEQPMYKPHQYGIDRQG